MTETCTIPPITDPLGAHWDQPDRASILIDATHALMTVATFKALHEYSCSNPSGVYEGKMWRRHDGVFDPIIPLHIRQSHEWGKPEMFPDYTGPRPVWLLCWFGPDRNGDKGFVSNNYRKILLVDG